MNEFGGWVLMAGLLTFIFAYVGDKTHSSVKIFIKDATRKEKIEVICTVSFLAVICFAITAKHTGVFL